MYEPMRYSDFRSGLILYVPVNNFSVLTSTSNRWVTSVTHLTITSLLWERKEKAMKENRKARKNNFRKERNLEKVPRLLSPLQFISPLQVMSIYVNYCKGQGQTKGSLRTLYPSTLNFLQNACLTCWWTVLSVNCPTVPIPSRMKKLQKQSDLSLPCLAGKKCLKFTNNFRVNFIITYLY